MTFQPSGQAFGRSLFGTVRSYPTSEQLRTRPVTITLKQTFIITGPDLPDSHVSTVETSDETGDSKWRSGIPFFRWRSGDEVKS